jgi:hypothetical protein
MKFRIQTIMKSNQILFSKEIQISDPLLLEISLKSKVPRNFSDFFFDFNS